jgi:DNA-binding beta-propeller fold protein YncE
MTIIKKNSSSYLKTIGIANNGFNGRGFQNPYSIVVNHDKKIFVLNRCDPARRTAIRIGVFNLEEDYLYEFGQGYGTENGQFVWPVAMAFDTQGRLLITDEHNNRVTIFSTEGEYLTKWGTTGTKSGQFDGPSGIAVDHEGVVYISDQRNHRIQKYSEDGDFIGQWGSFGANKNQFNYPWGICVDIDANVFVADWRNDRIQKFNGDGEYLSTIGCSGDAQGQFIRPSAVSVDSIGNIYVADWGNERVQIFDNTGNFTDELRGEATLSKWAEDFLESNPDEKETRDISDLTPDIPDHLNTPYHISSQTEPFFWGPVSIYLDADDNLYVVESNRHRIQIYQK